MTETNETQAPEAQAAAPAPQGKGRGRGPGKGGQGHGGGRGPGGDRGQGGDRNRGPRRERERQPGEEDGVEYVEKLVAINRVAKVVKGGKRFGFAAIVIVGDAKGRAGHGTGKAREVPEAIAKATAAARRNMQRIPLREGRTIHHDVRGIYGAGKVVLRTAPSGTGIIAGGPMRAVFEALGVQDVVAKSVGTSNPHNMIKATFEALKASQSPRTVAARRSKKVSDILGKQAKEYASEAAEG